MSVQYVKDSDIEGHKRQLLWWQKKGLQYTASGYGKKIPTSHMLKVKGRWYRVYVMQYSNAGSAYIVKNGRTLFLHDWQVGG